MTSTRTGPTPDVPISDVPRLRVHHLGRAKKRGERLTMLTAYDAIVAGVFDDAGIDILLVGDSMGTTVLGMPSTLTVALEDIERATRAVATAVRRAMVVADLPFGTYEDSPTHAFDSATRLMRAGAHAVKFEGGQRVASQVQLIASAGIPVIGHIGFTPQSEHGLGGPRIQGRDAASLDTLTADAVALQEAGASAIVLELMPADAAATLTDMLQIPTIGIGAGPHCDAQVLVWTDMVGLTPRPPRFARAFGQARRDLQAAAGAYAEAVRNGAYPDPEHSY
ncbi:MAG: 3-methyl-2-oxobutanoate hydroxymethyltransferase [Bifidobacteriaceae bacterium]|jgi:3-methyl-2-oxobutanoate hydroxymethyltransferase|nr:3-methyl-2-oxobutanoate hydroxymethyltransferase [Bifidobacteriaceae bacterium]